MLKSTKGGTMLWESFPNSFLLLLSFSKMMKVAEASSCKFWSKMRNASYMGSKSSVTSNFKMMLICQSTLMWLHKGGRSIYLVWNRSGSPQLLLDLFCAFLVFCKTNFTLKVVFFCPKYQLGIEVVASTRQLSNNPVPVKSLNYNWITSISQTQMNKKIQKCQKLFSFF